MRTRCVLPPHRTRGVRIVVAAAAALSLTLLTLWVGAAPSRADDGVPQIEPDAVTAIEIHKLRQPDSLLPAASGLPQDTSGMTPVAGATFTATRVPGIDLTTSAGQQTTAALTAERAGVLAAGAPAAARATTDSGGDASLSGLGVGVYLVREVATPAGYAPAVPFLVALPLTDPVTRDGWLYTVHVYPKNAYAGISLTDVDHDAVALGDAVAWRSLSGIPNAAVIDGYRLVERMDARLALLGNGPDDGAVSIRCDDSRARSACTQPIAGVDYTWVFDAATNELTVDFTPAGLAMLARAVALDPAAQVALAYRTTVTADGDLTTHSLLYASRAAIDGGAGAPAPVSDSATTRWGPLAIVVHERGNPQNLIAGATFRLYRTAADAASGSNPIVVGGSSEWTTDARGRIDVAGLRFSGFVDGLDRPSDDPVYRFYYAVPIAFPSGYTGSNATLRTIVESTTDAQVVTVEVWRTSGGGGLPVTGGRIPWAIGAIAVGAVGAGILLIVRRRDRRDRPEEPGRP